LLGEFKIMVQNDIGEFVMPFKKLDNNNSKMDEILINKIKELSKLRKSISLDLKTIARKTKISTNQLKNIESCNFDRLPPNPMRNSFINQYCSQIEKLNKIS
tara:strand:- start:961 stop:1266 length:306 start_codon:yes stop_codon:yes gene_type:complete